MKVGLVAHEDQALADRRAFKNLACIGAQREQFADSQIRACDTPLRFRAGVTNIQLQDVGHKMRAMVEP